MRDGYHDDIRRFVKNLEHRDLGHRAVDAYFDHLNAGELDDTRLAAVITGATCPAIAVWNRCTGFLYDWAIRHAKARDAAMSVMRTGRASARFQIVAGLMGRHDLPREFLLEILRTGLCDRSAKVRLFAAQRTEELGVIELLSDLQNRQQSETDPELAKSMGYHAALLRDGFVLQPPLRGSTDPQIIVRIKTGWTGQAVPLDAIEKLGLPKVAELIRTASENYDHVDWDEATAAR